MAPELESKSIQNGHKNTEGMVNFSVCVEPKVSTSAVSCFPYEVDVFRAVVAQLRLMLQTFSLHPKLWQFRD